MDEVKTVMEQEDTLRTEVERKHQVSWPYLRLAGERRTHALANSNSKAMFTDVAAPSPHCFFANAASARRFFNDSAASTSFIQSIVPFLRVMEWSKFAHQKHSQRAVYVPTEAAVELRTFDTIIGLEDVETFFSPSIFRTSELLYQLSPMVTKNNLWDIRLQAQKEEDQGDNEDNKAEQAIDLVWDSYGGCTGWGLESAQFVTQLEDKLRSVSIVADGRSFCKGFTLHARESLERLRLRMNLHVSEEDEDEYEAERAGRDEDSSFVWVSHKPPPSYPQFPYRGLVTVNKRPDIVIGRSMIETNSIPDEWVDICNDDSRVTEIWVPSSFLVEVFSSAGVRRDKLHVVPVPIDTHLFDPNAFPSRPSPPLPRPSSIHNNQNSRPFIFLSVFKMEERKGWDLLLRAFWDEFRNDPPGRVELHLQTYLYPTPPPPLLPRDESSILTFISFSFPQEIHQMYQRKLPPVRILSKEQKVSEMPKLFLSADAFVLPTRGEGFGMPIVEAMAMELPVIATNWSGPSDFLTEANSYPLRVEKMESAGFFENGGGGQWAKPDVKHLQRLMRRVMEEQETGEARRKGKRAREDVVERFEAERVAEMVQRRLVWLHHQKKQQKKV
ncbi:Glycosyltransferase, CAZy family GT4 [Balamuthia mandrillaris]